MSPEPYVCRNRRFVDTSAGETLCYSEFVNTECNPSAFTVIALLVIVKK